MRRRCRWVRGSMLGTHSSVLVCVRGNGGGGGHLQCLWFSLPVARPQYGPPELFLVCDGGTSRLAGLGVGVSSSQCASSDFLPLRSSSVGGKKDRAMRSAHGPRRWPQQAEGRALQEVMVMGVRVGGRARRAQSQLIGGSRRRYGRSYGQRTRQKSRWKGFGKLLEVGMSRVRLSKAAGLTSKSRSE